jgi:hypothetical protein
MLSAVTSFQLKRLRRLSDDVDTLKRQLFHLGHEADFRDSEELEDRPPVLLYEKSFVLSYLQNVRRKAQETIAWESAEVLGWDVGISPPQLFARRAARL